MSSIEASQLRPDLSNAAYKSRQRRFGPCYSRGMIVMKFGGTSVEDAAAIDRSCRIVGERVSRKPFVVVSALGGATNGLLEAGSFAARSELGKAMTIADRLEYRHT